MIEVECHISISKDGNILLNPLNIRLLKEIKKSGSLNDAAKKAKISYQHAWMLIETMNMTAPVPVALKSRGGAHGGGTEISEYGIRILMEYEQIEIQVKNLIQRINVEINL